MRTRADRKVGPFFFIKKAAPLRGSCIASNTNIL